MSLHELLVQLKEELEEINEGPLSREFTPPSPEGQLSLAELNYGNRALLPKGVTPLQPHVFTDESTYSEHALSALLQLVNIALKHTPNIKKDVLADAFKCGSLATFLDPTTFVPLIIDEPSYNVGVTLQKFLNAVLDLETKEIVSSYNLLPGVSWFFSLEDKITDAKEYLKEMQPILERRLTIYTAHTPEKIEAARTQLTKKSVYTKERRAKEESLATPMYMWSFRNHKSYLMQFQSQFNTAPLTGNMSVFEENFAQLKLDFQTFKDDFQASLATSYNDFLISWNERIEQDSLEDEIEISAYLSELIANEIRGDNAFEKAWYTLYQSDSVEFKKISIKNELLTPKTFIARSENFFTEIIENFELFLSIMDENLKERAALEEKFRQFNLAIEEIKNTINFRLPDFFNDEEGVLVLATDESAELLENTIQYEHKLISDIKLFEEKFAQRLEDNPELKGRDEVQALQENTISSLKARLAQLTQLKNNIKDVVNQQSAEAAADHLQEISNQIDSAESLEEQAREKFKHMDDLAYNYENDTYIPQITSLNKNFSPQIEKLNEKIDRLKKRLKELPTNLNQINDQVEKLRKFQAIINENKSAFFPINLIPQNELINLLELDEHSLLKEKIAQMYQDAQQGATWYGLNRTNINRIFGNLVPSILPSANEQILEAIDNKIESIILTADVVKLEKELSDLEQTLASALAPFQKEEENLSEQAEQAKQELMLAKADHSLNNINFINYTIFYQLPKLKESIEKINLEENPHLATEFNQLKKEHNYYLHELSENIKEIKLQLTKINEMTNLSEPLIVRQNNLLADLKRYQDAAHKLSDTLVSIEPSLGRLETLQSLPSELLPVYLKLEASDNKRLADVEKEFLPTYLEETISNLELLSKIPNNLLNTYLKIQLRNPETLRLMSSSKNSEILLGYLRVESEHPGLRQTLPPELFQLYLRIERQLHEVNELLRAINKEGITDEEKKEQIIKHGKQIEDFSENKLVFQNYSSLGDLFANLQASYFNLSPFMDELDLNFSGLSPMKVNHLSQYQPTFSQKYVNDASETIIGIRRESPYKVITTQDVDEGVKHSRDIGEKYFGRRAEKNVKESLGVFGDYLKERAKTFWVNDLFEVSLILFYKCLGISSDANQRQRYINDLKAVFKKGDQAEVESKIQQGLDLFKPRSGTKENPDNKSLCAKLIAFRDECRKELTIKPEDDTSSLQMK